MTFAMYGIAVLVVLALAWASAEHVKQKLALVLLASWTSTNVAVFNLGFQNAAGVLAGVAGVMALVVGVLGFRNRSIPALIVVGLYVSVILLTILCITHGLTDSYYFWLSRNLLFLAQLVVVGGASGVAALDRTGPRAHRLQPRRAVS